MRNLAKKDALEEAAGHNLGKTLEIKQLDVCDEQSIKTCVNSIPDRRIDVLGKYRMWTDKYCFYPQIHWRSFIGAFFHVIKVTVIA